MKRCSRCRLLKPLNKFHRSGSNGRRSDCRVCRSRAQSGRKKGTGYETLPRDLVLDKLTSSPTPVRELRRLIRDDWGSVSDRSLYRALETLRKRGLIRRVGTRFSPQGGWVRSEQQTTAGRRVAACRALLASSLNDAE